MTDTWAVWSLLGLSHLELAERLRVLLDAGTPIEEVLREGASYGLHPLSIALAAPETDRSRQNRRLARLLGIEKHWFLRTEDTGFNTKRSGCEEFPQGLAARFLELTRAECLDRIRQNRRVARRLGVEKHWFSCIGDYGLSLQGSRVEALPEGLAVRLLQITRADSLQALPRALAVYGLKVEQCRRLKGIPLIPGLRDLTIVDCRNLRELPVGMDLKFLKVSACPSLEHLPPVRVQILKLASCPMVDLPRGMGLNWLSLRRMDRLEWLPLDLEEQERGTWHIEKCPRLKVLPWDGPLTPSALALALSAAGLAKGA